MADNFDGSKNGSYLVADMPEVAAAIRELADIRAKIVKGWMLVPVMPTPKMLGAMRSTSINRHSDMYQAALAAAPTKSE